MTGFGLARAAEGGIESCRWKGRTGEDAPNDVRQLDRRTCSCLPDGRPARRECSAIVSSISVPFQLDRYVPRYLLFRNILCWITAYADSFMRLLAAGPASLHVSARRHARFMIKKLPGVHSAVQGGRFCAVTTRTVRYLSPNVVKIIAFRRLRPPAAPVSPATSQHTVWKPSIPLSNQTSRFTMRGPDTRGLAYRQPPNCGS